MLCAAEDPRDRLRDEIHDRWFRERHFMYEARARSHAWPARTVGPINISRESVKGRKCERHGGEGDREPAAQERQAGACNRFAPGERARCCALFNSTRYCTVTHHHLTHMALRGTNLSSSRVPNAFFPVRKNFRTRDAQSGNFFATNNARRIASHEGQDRVDSPD